MLRRRFKSITRAAVLALAATTGMVVLPPQAGAVTLPPLSYSAVSLAPDLTYPTHIVSQSDGGVTVGDCGTGINTSGFKQFGNTGTATQSVADTVSGRPISYCDRQAAVGTDGTVYTVAFNPGTNKDVLLAFQGGAQQWMYAPPCATISAVELGVNGNIYMLASGSSGCSGQRLLGVEPTLATGQTTPTVVANTLLYRTLPYRGGLSPYSGGVIVRYTDGVGYFTHTGTQQQEYTVPAGHYDGGPFATINGWAIVPILDQAPRPFNCDTDTQAAEYIVAYSVSGAVWSNQLPQCTRVDAIRPMPDGGAVAMVKLRDNNLQTLTQHFVGIAPETGQAFRWTSGSLAPESGVVRHGHSFVTDLNGNLVTQQHLKRNAGSADYFEVVTSTSSGYTGIGFGKVTFAGGTSDGYGFSPPAGLGAIPAIGDDTAYAALVQCNASNYCNPSTTKLYAASVPGMAMDYPRGAVLKYNEPWLEYVALGDSFSSGEGVPEFEPGTDTNGCHRSAKAYSKLLANNPQSRLNLTDFVACSGATTADVINGKNGENPQLDALSANTDIVTITIGGNDIGFTNFAKKCVGWPTELASDCTGSVEYQTSMHGINNVLPGNLTRTALGNEGVLRRIRTAAPNAQVYVLGYPQLAPTSDEPHVWPWCAWINSDDEHEVAREVVTSLNTRLRQAVTTMGAGFTFVDPNASTSPFVNHELCDGETYFNGTVGPPNEEFSLHPNARGQDAYRRLLLTSM